MNLREVGNGGIITIITVIIKVVFVFKNYFQKIKISNIFFREIKNLRKLFFRK